MDTNTHQKIALFIDADNAPASRIDMIMSEAAKYGVVTIRRAYGNWKSQKLKPWEDLLLEHAIQPIQQYDLIKEKTLLTLPSSSMPWTFSTRKTSMSCVLCHPTAISPRW